jgi:pyrroline-5-carboxylate reductase
LSQNLYSPPSIIISDPVLARREYLHDKYGVVVTGDNQSVLRSPVILLAIKPQVLRSVLELLKFDNSHLIISILAGISLAKLAEILPQQPLVRAMPNTPAMVGAGMSAIAVNDLVTTEQKQIALRIFETIGEVVEVPESLMDGITGVSGSGPAYVAMMVEALADGGVAVGLPRAIAQKLALQTVFGTGKLLMETGLHPGQLKDQVSSPGGTTIAGVRTLEDRGMRSAIIEAVISASSRATELGK